MNLAGDLGSRLDLAAVPGSALLAPCQGSGTGLAHALLAMVCLPAPVP